MSVETVSINDSILNSIKKLIGPDYDYGPFDRDIIMHINSAFMILNQIGLGPTTPFRITGSDQVWIYFIPIFQKLYNEFFCFKLAQRATAGT